MTKKQIIDIITEYLDESVNQGLEFESEISEEAFEEVITDLLRYINVVIEGE